MLTVHSFEINELPMDSEEEHWNQATFETGIEDGGVVCLNQKKKGQSFWSCDLQVQ